MWRRTAAPADTVAGHGLIRLEAGFGTTWPDARMACHPGRHPRTTWNRRDMSGRWGECTHTLWKKLSPSVLRRC